MVNRVSDPNFVVPNRKEAIGITVISLSHLDLVEDWRISSDCFFSDHRYLEQTFILINLVSKKTTISCIQVIETAVSNLTKTVTAHTYEG